MVTTIATMDESTCKLEQVPAGTANMPVSQSPPSPADWARVAGLPVLDAQRNAVPFGSLLAQEDGRRTLVLFVRHFFCGICQEFIKSLCSSITPDVLATLPTPTSVVIIGCGQPDLIDFYAATTQCPYPIYAEPTKKLYAQLGMGRTLDLGPRQPDYMQKPLASMMLSSVGQVLANGRKAFKGGDYWQVGGEFLLERDQTIFCHRMSNTRDHSEVSDLRKALDLPAEPVPVPDRHRRWRRSGSRARAQKAVLPGVQKTAAAA